MKIETLYGGYEKIFFPFLSLDVLSRYRRKFKELTSPHLFLGNCPKEFSIKCVLELSPSSTILLSRFTSRVQSDPILKEGLRHLYSLKFSDPFKETGMLPSEASLDSHRGFGRILNTSGCPAPYMVSELIFRFGNALSRYTRPGYAWPGNTLWIDGGPEILGPHSVESAKLYFSEMPEGTSRLQVGKHIPVFKDVGLGVSPQAFTMLYLGDTPLRLGTGNPEKDLEMVCGTLAIIRYESFFELGIPVYLYDPEGKPLREIFLDIVRPSPKWRVEKNSLLSANSPNLSSDERDWNSMRSLLTQIGEFYSE